jgi:hypothetical protein
MRRQWLPFFFVPRPLYPVGAQDEAYLSTTYNPLYQDSFHVMDQLRTRAPNTAYTNQGRTAVSIDPMSQGFAGVLAVQNLIAMQGQSS